MGNSDNLDTQRQNAEAAVQTEDVKMFTQEEVDEIVGKRLARERRKTGQENTDDPAEIRERSLADRELKVMAKEKLMEKGLPTDLADVLRYSDEKTLETALEAISALKLEPRKAWGQRMGSSPGRVRDPFRDAMGLK